MPPAPGWYFGSKNQFADRPFGGFNLGGIQDSPPVQSTVATPNPASAGVAGQPAQPSSNGGMSALGVPFDQTGGPSSDSPAATPSGPGFSVGEAASTAGRGGSLSLGQTGLPGFTGLGSLSPNAVTTMNGLMGVTGLPTMAMGPAAVPFGLALKSIAGQFSSASRLVRKIAPGHAGKGPTLTTDGGRSHGDQAGENRRILEGSSTAAVLRWVLGETASPWLRRQPPSGPPCDLGTRSDAGVSPT